MNVNDQVIYFLRKLEVVGFAGVRAAREYLQEGGLSLEADDVEHIHRWLLDAAEQGDARAQHALAEFYLRGVFGYMDTAAAHRWSVQAVQGDYPPAMVLLAGLRSEDQSFADADLSETTRLLKRAVDLGYGPAACHLGISYLLGDTSPRNPDLARNYFAKGAEWGDAGSMFHLASILLDEGGEDDCRWALELLDRAAGLDQLESISSLASIYREGRYGRDQDLEKASFYDARYEVVARPLFYKIDALSFLRPRVDKRANDD